MKFTHLLHCEVMSPAKADISVTFNEFNWQFWIATQQKEATSLSEELSTIEIEKDLGANVFSAIFRLSSVFEFIKVRIKCYD